MLRGRIGQRRCIGEQADKAGSDMVDAVFVVVPLGAKFARPRVVGGTSRCPCVDNFGSGEGRRG